MKLAFLTGALASGFGISALATAIIWGVTLASGSTDPWGVAAWLVPSLGGLGAVATYTSEISADRLGQQRKRATGEPWAYRED